MIFRIHVAFKFLFISLEISKMIVQYYMFAFFGDLVLHISAMSSHIRNHNSFIKNRWFSILTSVMTKPHISETVNLFASSLSPSDMSTQVLYIVLYVVQGTERKFLPEPCRQSVYTLKHDI